MPVPSHSVTVCAIRFGFASTAISHKTAYQTLMDFNDYWNIDAILAENQKIQCKFKQRIPDMGHLGANLENDARLTFQPLTAGLSISPFHASTY